MKLANELARRRIKQVHFVGIGGAGMGGIAEVIAHLGYAVTGSDIASSAMTDRLIGLGAQIKIGHAAENIAGANVVVTSSAVNDENPEVIEARANGIPVVPRAEMLAEIMRFSNGIAVAGTHGKTTTTSLVTSLLAEGGMDPTFIIGGKLNSTATNSRLGSGEYLVAEADESDIVSYGIHYEADVRAVDVRYDGPKSYFNVERKGKATLAIELNMPGEHNVQNALAAIAVAAEVGVSDEAIQNGLARFQGVGRRFHCYGELATANGKILLVDDYGHHPTEMTATINAVRTAWPGKRLVTLFQPHRFTRTRDLFEDFAAVLSETDTLLLMDVYAASEEPIPGADGRSLARAIRNRGKVDPIFIADNDDVLENLGRQLQDGDVLLTLGAGSVGAISAALPEQLSITTSEAGSV